MIARRPPRRTNPNRSSAATDSLRGESVILLLLEPRGELRVHGSKIADGKRKGRVVSTAARVLTDASLTLGIRSQVRVDELVRLIADNVPYGTKLVRCDHTNRAAR